MVRGLNALAVSRFTDNPNSTARRNWRARWESNPHLPNFFGCSIAVELRDCPRSSAHGAHTSRMRFGPKQHTRCTNFTDAVLSRARRDRRASANYDGQVVMLAEGLQMAGFEPAPLEIALRRSVAIKLPPPDGGG